MNQIFLIRLIAAFFFGFALALVALAFRFEAAAIGPFLMAFFFAFFFGMGIFS
jgi:hypothetical protein